MSENSDSILQLHGIELFGALIFHYLTSSSFSCDVLYTFLENTTFSGGGIHPASRLLASMGVLSQRMGQRVVECMLVATLMDSRYELLQDAALLHLLLEYVQKYRFYQLWLTRVLYKVGNLLFLPELLWGKTSEEDLLMRHDKRKKNSGSDKTKGVDNSEDVLNSLPVEYQRTLLFFRHCYDRSVPYAVFASGLVTDMTQQIVEQAAWATAFIISRNKHTSRWRLLKPYLCCTTRSAMETTLVYFTRVTGAWVGRRLSHTATDGKLFWCERLLVLFASPFICYGSRLVAARLRERLELLHPATAEDEMEDRREAEEAAEEEEEELPNIFRHTYGMDDANNNNNNNNNNNGNGGDPMGRMSGAQPVDLYEVLGVQPSASNEEIRRAYRQSALSNHPDRVGNEPGKQKAAQEQMVLINQAYEVLSSTSKRNQYDRSRRMETMMGNFDSPIIISGSSLSVAVWGLAGAILTVSLIFSTRYFTAFHNLTGPGRSPLRFLGLV